MRAWQSHTPAHFSARATSGQHLEIRYDPDTHALIFAEADWSADGRGGAAPRTVFREQLDSHKIRRLPHRRAG